MSDIRRAASYALASALLAGCVTFNPPDKANPVARNVATSYDAAMAHLQSARTGLLAKARGHETYDTVTKAGVAVGIAGAGVSSALDDSSKKVISFLTLGAVSYIANQDVAPAPLAAVYRAGVTNLECIRSAALIAKSDADALMAEIGPGPVDNLQSVRDINAAIDALRSDIDFVADVRNFSGPNESPDSYTNAVDEALQAIASAETVKRQLRRYYVYDGIGEAVLAGVNATIGAVNQQALAKSPSIDAIIQSGSAFGSFMDAGAGWAKQIATAKANAAAAFTKGGQGGADIGKRFIADKIKLQLALSKVPSVSLDADLAAIQQCRVAAGGLKPVTVSPNPVVLTAGGDAVKLALTGAAPFSIRRTANLPHGVSVEGGSTLVLKAADEATIGDFSIDVVDANGVESGDVPAKVQKAAAKGGSSDAPAQGGAAGAQTGGPASPSTNAALTVTPNPITLTVGAEPIDLKISGTSPFTLKNLADLPKGVTFDGKATPPKLKADTTAAPADFKLIFLDASSAASAEVPVKVQKKPAASGGGAH